jgi:ATP-dependent Clp protease protease subunit
MWPSHPEVPYPFPPERRPPERTEPALVPLVYESTGRGPIERLYDRRTILLGGPLDAAASTHIAACLMSLDGRSADDVEVLINSPGGPVEEVFAVLDVIALMRGPVTTTCFGQAFGTAAVVLAAGTGRRRATPNAMVSLRCPEVTAIAGSAREIEHLATHARIARQRLSVFVASVTRLPVERIEHELDAGGPLAPPAALDLHLIDGIMDTA